MFKQITSNKRVLQITVIFLVILTFILILAMHSNQERHNSTVLYLMQHSIRGFELRKIPIDWTLQELYTSVSTAIDNHEQYSDDDRMHITMLTERLDNQVSHMLGEMIQFFSIPPIRDLVLVKHSGRSGTNLRVNIMLIEADDIQLLTGLKALILSIQEVNSRHSALISGLYPVSERREAATRINEWVAVYNDYIDHIPIWERMIRDAVGR